MELRRLRYFVAAAEEEHFHRGAARLNIAQPALSRQVRELEAEIGIVLFERQGGRARLTEAGRAFLEDARDLLHQAEQARERASRIAAGRIGIARIGFSAVAMENRLVPLAMREFQMGHADVRLELIRMASLKQIEALRNGQIEAAFGFSRPDNSMDFDHVSIATDQIVLAVPKAHRLARRRNVRLVDLKSEKFVWVRHGYHVFWHEQVVRACAAVGLVPNIVLELDDESALGNLVEAGMGIAFCYASRQEWSSDKLAFVRIADLSLSYRLELVWLKTNKSQLLSDLVATVDGLLRNRRPIGRAWRAVQVPIRK